MKLKRFLFSFLFFTFGLIGLTSCDAQSGTGFGVVDNKAVIEKLEDKSVVIIDVRTPGEVSQGYIKGADLFIDFNGSDFEKKINELDKNKTYYVYCRSGARSGNASSYMVKNGFKDVYNITGGIIKYSGEIIK